MIHIDSLSAGWLLQKQSEFNRDPGLIEKMVYALHLVEQLQVARLPFIFKGGTSLILLMDQPLRFSIDIDIVTPPDLSRQQMEEYLNRVMANSAFKAVVLDERRSYKEGVPKAHYKFLYASNVPTKDKEKGIIKTPDREILLDMLFASNPYPALVHKPVITSWVINEGDPVMVHLPCINSIAGDKMVAFAPCTTGVPYFANKEREIIKQLFDIGNLYDEIQDTKIVRAAYHNAAIAEMQYRAERGIKSVEDILNDTIATALILANCPQCADGDEQKLKELQTGIIQFTHFVFDRKGYKLEDAKLSSAKAAYLAAYLLRGETGPLPRFDKARKEPVTNYMVVNPQYNWLNKRLKFVKGGEALFYWFQTIQLLYPLQGG